MGTEAGLGRVGDAVGAITRHIRETNLMPGDRLPSEMTLSRELNVSRSVVREAFRSLAAMRIIELGAGRRATVAALDHGPMSLIIEHGVLTQQINVQQIYDVRRTIATQVLTLMGAEGRLVRAAPMGAWTTRQHTWEPGAARWPGGIERLDPDAARAALVEAYLRRFGPATETDVVWWTGWAQGTARRALATSSRNVGSPPIPTRNGTGFTNIPTTPENSGPGRPDTRVATTTSS